MGVINQWLLGLALVLGCVWSVQAQTTEQPIFAGCEDAIKGGQNAQDCSEMKMYQFIFSNLKHPEEARKANISGSVMVKMMIEADGSVKDPKIVKGLGHGCDEEVLRVVGQMPKWQAGKLDGAAKAMEIEIEVKFAVKG